MIKPKLYIIDSVFSHAYTSSWYNKSKKFDWVREINSTLIFTDNDIELEFNYPNSKKFAWLIESPEINPGIYNYIKENHSNFEKVFTFDKQLLDLSDKFFLIPIGGCWIREEERTIHDKTKLISAILSSKKTTTGHLLRHDVKNNIKNVDFFGHNNFIENKISGLKNYAFSIAIENCKKDYYFTEKLIDCFMTGTIPLYWGCPSIDKFFDVNGIITFDSLEELIFICENLTFNDYVKKLESVQYNYEQAKKFLIADDLIFEFLNKRDTTCY